MNYYIGIDLGGTNIVSAVVDEDYTICAKVSCKTNLPQPAQSVADAMTEMSLQAVKQAGLTLDEIQSIGIGSPGTINPVSGTIEYSCNFDFYDVPLAEMIAQRTGKPTCIDNDANAAALGEFLAGAGTGTSNMVALTLGTGIGGGVIIDKKLFTGFNYSGTELGHTVIVQGGRPCTCGRNGCFETYASATGLIKTTVEMMDKFPDSKMWDFAPTPAEANGATSFQAMRAGDSAAKEVVDQFISQLACGVTNMINIFQPEILCIGGGISKEGDALIDPVTKLVDQEDYARYSKKRTKVVAAKLGNDAGIIGAAMLNLQK